jgi:hypothetical protein
MDYTYNLFYKYGLADNMVLITSNPLDITRHTYYGAKNPHISHIIGGTVSELTTNANNINALKTDKNEIYAWETPYSLESYSDEFIALCGANGWKIYEPHPLNWEAVINRGVFTKGVNLCLVEGVKNIKDKSRNYADSIVDSYLQNQA